MLIDTELFRSILACQLQTSHLTNNTRNGVLQLQSTFNFSERFHIHDKLITTFEVDWAAISNPVS